MKMQLLDQTQNMKLLWLVKNVLQLVVNLVLFHLVKGKQLIRPIICLQVVVLKSVEQHLQTHALVPRLKHGIIIYLMILQIMEHHLKKLDLVQKLPL